MATQKDAIYDFFKFDMHISDEHFLRSMVNNTKVVKLQRGDQLEEAKDTVVLLLSGNARCYILDEDGKDVTFRFAYKPGSFLMTDIWADNSNDFFWEALSKSVFLLIPKKTMLSAFERDYPFRTHVLSIMQHQFHQESALRSSLVSKQAKERYLWFLETYQDFPSTIPLKYVATYLNMLPQTLSEVRGELKKKKPVKVKVKK